MRTEKNLLQWHLMSRHIMIRLYSTISITSFNFQVSRKAYNKEGHLRYGENPHQQGTYYGDFDALFEQLHGKELSYNNLVDVDAAVNLVQEFDEEKAFVIIKHTNACGVATGSTVKEAYHEGVAGRYYLRFWWGIGHQSDLLMRQRQRRLISFSLKFLLLQPLMKRRWQF